MTNGYDKDIHQKVIFIAGTYGVGKSTLCVELSRRVGIPSYSAGDLISAQNGEIYGANKEVKDKFANQRLLQDAIERLLNKNGPFFLAGHFCIFGKNNSIDILPESEIMTMNITHIILLEADTDRIVANLSSRDGKDYSNIDIAALQAMERAQAIKVSKAIGVPLIIHSMEFNGNDATALLVKLEGIIL